jgi:DNA-binding GntR family transcriptional regulator
MKMHIPTFSLKPLETLTGSATDRAFDAIYAAVISVELPPGTKVSEIEFAKQLDVSRQPIRDAFFRLSNLGFLSIRPQRPTLITQISLQAIHDAVFTRIALEVECLRQAVLKNKPKLIDEMEAILAAQDTALSKDVANFHALDEAFHELICNVAGHDHVWRLIRAQKGHLDRLRFLSLSQERRQVVVTEHREILSAITGGSRFDAEVLLRAHISAIKDILPTIVARYPDYFEKLPLNANVGAT